MKILILGGDKRNIELGRLLKKDGHRVKLFAFDNIVENEFEIKGKLEHFIKGFSLVIGPLPCSNDNVFFNTPLYSDEIMIEEVFKNMSSDQLFIGGRITNEIGSVAKTYNINAIDILKREEMAVLNAVPTAEGAIQIAMEELDITIHGANTMILGFGRISRVLSKMLQGIGAKVYIVARNHIDIAWIESWGYKSVNLNDIDTFIKYMDVIFNTIPYMILDGEKLEKLKKEVLIIDLASKPGGVDFEKSKELNLKTNWALGLPGKVAPKSAAEFMKDTIYNIIEEWGGAECY